MEGHRTLALSVVCAIALSVPGAAQSPSDVFAPPVRLKAGDKFLGEKRMYPSPVFHDVNGDGRLDIVIGDLRGALTFALREAGDGPARFAAEQKLMGAADRELKFHNW